MKPRLLASLFLLALAQQGFAAPLPAPGATAASAATSVTITTIKPTSVRVGNVTLPLSEGSKLEVLGREGDLLVVKFRSTQGKVPARDTDFNPTFTTVPEIAPDPAAKSADMTISSPAPARDVNTPSQESIASAQRLAATNQPPKKENRPVKAAKQSAPPPPVNN